MSIVSFEEVSFDFIYAYINTCTIYNKKIDFSFLKETRDQVWFGGRESGCLRMKPWIGYSAPKKKKKKITPLTLLRAKSSKGISGEELLKSNWSVAMSPKK